MAILIVFGAIVPGVLAIITMMVMVVIPFRRRHDAPAREADQA